MRFQTYREARDVGSQKSFSYRGTVQCRKDLEGRLPPRQ